MNAIIIGSGVAGIAASIRLAKKGYSVTVLEANAYAGGKLTTLQLGGYRFDAGPSLFTMPHFVDELLSLSKETPAFTYLKKEVVCEYFFDDGTEFTAYADGKAYVKEAVKKLDAKPELIQDYLENAKLKYDLTAGIFLEKSLHKWSTYLSGETIKAIAQAGKLNLNGTLNDTNLKRLGGNEKMVQLFNRYATYNGSSPYLTPGIMSMIPHLEHYYGTFFPSGGMVSITNALVETAKSLGVEFQFNTKVTEIVVENKVARGVKVGETFYPSDLVLTNMDVVPTYKILMPSQKAPAKTLAQERSSSAIIFYWGIKKEFKQLDLHNIFFSPDYEKEFKEIFEDKKVPADPTVYVHISSKDEPNDAPKGGENWFVMVNVPSNIGQDWSAERTRVRKAVIQRLNKALKCDVEALIEEEDYLDPTRIEERTSSFQGALYGAASNNKFAAFLRHPNFSQNIKHLYFCGGSVHPGGGIPLCLLSAKIVADLVPDVH